VSAERFMRWSKLLLVLASFATFSQQVEAGPRQTVRQFIAAFNAHDSAAMARFVTEDVQWLSVSGGSIAIETNGKAALVAAMTGYFRSCPTCRSQLAEIIASRDRISAVEIASWRGKDGQKTQRSISVYELSGGLIKRVYYFPVES
jgi:ketosteroid isomerase-like protein